jgi:hypothetical protein
MTFLEAKELYARRGIIKMQIHLGARAWLYFPISIPAAHAVFVIVNIHFSGRHHSGDCLCHSRYAFWCYVWRSCSCSIIHAHMDFSTYIYSVIAGVKCDLQHLSAVFIYEKCQPVSEHTGAQTRSQI